MRGQRTTKIIAVIALAASVVPLAHGQSGPTDNDIHAAYCASALTATIKRDSQRKPSANDLMREVWRGVINEQTKRRDRFGAYLEARGYFNSTNKTLADALAVATKRGEQEELQCDSDRTACLGKCAATNVTVGCIQQCKNLSSCQSIDACNSKDALPF